MYVYVVYDVGIERIDKVRKFLKMYLHWIQNSVFEGELKEKDFKYVKESLSSMISKEEDSVIFIILDRKSCARKEIIGITKNDVSQII
ncbi:MAG: CRISPR-associated endonuclease Cas2 [Candidatus Heimdallarchaeaceae archaeon]